MPKSSTPIQDLRKKAKTTVLTGANTPIRGEDPEDGSRSSSTGNLFHSSRKKKRSGGEPTSKTGSGDSKKSNLGAACESHPKIVSGLVDDQSKVTEDAKTKKRIFELLKLGVEVFTVSIAPKESGKRWLIVSKSSDVLKNDRLIFPSMTAYFDVVGGLPKLEANSLWQLNPEDMEAGSPGGYYLVLETSFETGLDLQIEPAWDHPSVASRFPGRVSGLEFSSQPVLVLRSTTAVSAQSVGVAGTTTAAVGPGAAGKGVILTSEQMEKSGKIHFSEVCVIDSDRRSFWVPVKAARSVAFYESLSLRRQIPQDVRNHVLEYQGSLAIPREFARRLLNVQLMLATGAAQWEISKPVKDRLNLLFDFTRISEYKIAAENFTRPQWAAFVYSRYGGVNRLGLTLDDFTLVGSTALTSMESGTATLIEVLTAFEAYCKFMSITRFAPEYLRIGKELASELTRKLLASAKPSAVWFALEMAMQAFGETCCQVESFLPEPTEPSEPLLLHHLVCIERFENQFSAERFELTVNHVFQFDSWKSKFLYEPILDNTLSCTYLPGIGSTQFNRSQGSSASPSHDSLAEEKKLGSGICLTQFCHVFKVPLVNGAVPDKCIGGTHCPGKLHPELNPNGKLDKKTHSLVWTEFQKRGCMHKLANTLGLTLSALNEKVELVKWEG